MYVPEVEMPEETIVINCWTYPLSELNMCLPTGDWVERNEVSRFNQYRFVKR